MNQPIRLLQLYPKHMNIYGDWGNTLTLKRRLEWQGYPVELLSYDIGDTFPDNVDLVVGGGGQDSGQDTIQSDLLQISPKLHELAEHDVPMLMICGLYQLFGKFFQTRDGHTIKGIGLFDIETYGSHDRMIGNIVTESDIFGQIIGYENHSGKTRLGPQATPLGRVLKGAGNNGEDDTEGVIYKNVVGSYLHGSLLPKNPVLADWLIEKAVVRKFGSMPTHFVDDRFAELARDIAIGRPR